MSVFFYTGAFLAIVSFQNYHCFSPSGLQRKLISWCLLPNAAGLSLSSSITRYAQNKKKNKIPKF